MSTTKKSFALLCLFMAGVLVPITYASEGVEVSSKTHESNRSRSKETKELQQNFLAKLLSRVNIFMVVSIIGLIFTGTLLLSNLSKIDGGRIQNDGNCDKKLDEGVQNDKNCDKKLDGGVQNDVSPHLAIKET